jgi:hypothetical protein
MIGWIQITVSLLLLSAVQLEVTGSEIVVGGLLPEGRIVILMLVEELKHVIRSVKLATCYNVVVRCRMQGTSPSHTVCINEALVFRVDHNTDVSLSLLCLLYVTCT